MSAAEVSASSRMLRRDHRRALLTGRVVLVISVVAHTAEIALFAGLERPLLAYLNVLSVLVLALGLIRIFRSDRFLLAWCLLIGELIINNALTTLVLGLGTGFVLYPALGVGIASTIPFCALRWRAALFAATLTVLSGVVVIVAVAGPVDPLAATTTFWLLSLNVLYMTLGAVAVLWFFTFEIGRAERDLEREYARSEALLSSILPAPIAERLKAGETTIADDYGDVTVLFADIVGFTARAARLSAAETVTVLEDLFEHFDQLAQAHGVEKIKTVGDSYMAVSGLVEAGAGLVDEAVQSEAVSPADHAVRAVSLAIDMLDLTRAHVPPDGQPLALRIGLHSGPLVGGVIGKRRMTFDCWGDVVNTASRMEAGGEPGCIQVSDATYRRLAGRFPARDRGEMEIKGKGAMRTWVIDPRNNT